MEPEKVKRILEQSEKTEGVYKYGEWKICKTSTGMWECLRIRPCYRVWANSIAQGIEFIEAWERNFELTKMQVLSKILH